MCFWLEFEQILIFNTCVIVLVLKCEGLLCRFREQLIKTVCTSNRWYEFVEYCQNDVAGHLLKKTIYFFLRKVVPLPFVVKIETCELSRTYFFIGPSSGSEIRQFLRRFCERKSVWSLSGKGTERNYPSPQNRWIYWCASGFSWNSSVAQIRFWPVRRHYGRYVLRSPAGRFLFQVLGGVVAMFCLFVLFPCITPVSVTSSPCQTIYLSFCDHQPASAICHLPGSAKFTWNNAPTQKQRHSTWTGYRSTRSSFWWNEQSVPSVLPRYNPIHH